MEEEEDLQLRSTQKAEESEGEVEEKGQEDKEDDDAVMVIDDHGQEPKSPKVLTPQNRTAPRKGMKRKQRIELPPPTHPKKQHPGRKSIGIHSAVQRPHRRKICSQDHNYREKLKKGIFYDEKSPEPNAYEDRQVGNETPTHNPKKTNRRVTKKQSRRKSCRGSTSRTNGHDRTTAEGMADYGCTICRKREAGEGGERKRRSMHNKERRRKRREQEKQDEEK